MRNLPFPFSDMISSRVPPYFSSPDRGSYHGTQICKRLGFTLTLSQRQTLRRNWEEDGCVLPSIATVKEICGGDARRCVMQNSEVDKADGICDSRDERRSKDFGCSVHAGRLMKFGEDLQRTRGRKWRFWIWRVVFEARNEEMKAERVCVSGARVSEMTC